jgi:hypothetical protein
LLPVGSVYYDTTSNSLKLYSADGISYKWFRVLTRKDIIAFTIAGATATSGFDICANNSYTIVPSGTATIGVSGSMPSTACNEAGGYQIMRVTVPMYIPNPIVTATWATANGTSFELTPIVVYAATALGSVTYISLAYRELSSVVQDMKINVVVMDPN